MNDFLLANRADKPLRSHKALNDVMVNLNDNIDLVQDGKKDDAYILTTLACYGTRGMCKVITP